MAFCDRAGRAEALSMERCCWWGDDGLLLFNAASAFAIADCCVGWRRPRGVMMGEGVVPAAFVERDEANFGAGSNSVWCGAEEGNESGPSPSPARPSIAVDRFLAGVGALCSNVGCSVGTPSSVGNAPHSFGSIAPDTAAVRRIHCWSEVGYDTI